MMVKAFGLVESRDRFRALANHSRRAAQRVVQTGARRARSAFIARVASAKTGVLNVRASVIRQPKFVGEAQSRGVLEARFKISSRKTRPEHYKGFSLTKQKGNRAVVGATYWRRKPRSKVWGWSVNRGNAQIWIRRDTSGKVTPKPPHKRGTVQIAGPDMISLWRQPYIRLPVEETARRAMIEDIDRRLKRIYDRAARA